MLLLTWCSLNQKTNIQTQNYQQNYQTQPAIYTWNNPNWVLVAVSDPHIYSKTWPDILKWSFYFDPTNFYHFNKNLALFKNAYNKNFDWKKVFYYDENAWATAWLVVYVLRNIYNQKNVYLWINENIKKNLWKNSVIPVNNTLTSETEIAPEGYIWTWKYLVVYDPYKIEFKTWDLLLYSIDLGTMKLDKFYKESKNVEIKNLYWSHLIDIYWNLKPSSEIKKLTKPLELEKYNRVFIYYPWAWYKGGVMALILQENE